MVQFESSQRPTLHITLPILYQVMNKLEHISNGGEVWRNNCKKMVQPSVYSRKLSELVKKHIERQL